VFYLVAAGALGLDQLSKAVARSALEPGRVVPIIPGFFSLRLSQNPGAAFGALGLWPPLLVLIGLVAVVAILGLRAQSSRSLLLAGALGLLLGGAVGNLTDRILFGSVTDFLDFGLSAAGRVLRWPTFNFADIALTVGIVLLLYHVFIRERRELRTS
jgi:signal peptidase II